MHRLTVTRRLLLMAVCAVGSSACSTTDNPVQAAPVPMVVGPTVSRGGLEGLAQDIDWARSLPADVKLGSSDGPISRDALVSTLEGLVHSSPSGASLSRAAISPSAAKHDYGFGDVGAGSTMYYLYTDAQGLRWVKMFAYTTCNQGSMVVAKIEMSAAWYYFQTNQLLYQWPIWGRVYSAPNYASNSASAGLGGTTSFRAQGYNRHTCEWGGDPSNYPFVYTSPFTVI